MKYEGLYDSGYVKVLDFQTNGSSNEFADAIGYFGLISFEPHLVRFNGPKTYSYKVSKYVDQDIYYVCCKNQQDMPYFNEGNAMIEVKTVDNKDDTWSIIKIEAKQDAAEDLMSKMPDINTDPCFVATAVYGDSNCLEVEKLRYWRDSFLSERSLGRRFIDYYYENGARWADLIEPYPVLKKTIKSCLDIFTKFIK